MKKLTTIITAAILALVLAACSSAIAPQVTGNWSGTVGPYAMTMNLTQNGTSVNGTGRVIGQPLTYTGTFVNPNLNVTVTCSTCDSGITVTARMRANTMEATWNYDGQQVPVSLTR